jgi:hypothetical protein
MVIVGRREDDPTAAATATAPADAEGGSRCFAPEVLRGSSDASHVCRVGGVLYAVGLRRTGKKLKDPEKGLSILRGGSFPDHAVVIYKKKAAGNGDDDGGVDGGGEWTAHRLLASVELKGHSTSGSIFDCMSFRTRKRRRTTGATRPGDGSMGGSGRDDDAGAETTIVVTGVA